jgi:hypothetical protein
MFGVFAAERTSMTVIFIIMIVDRYKDNLNEILYKRYIIQILQQKIMIKVVCYLGVDPEFAILKIVI